EHLGDVDAALLDEVEIVGDAVLAAAVDLLHAEGVGPDDADFLEVQRRPLEAAGCAYAGHDQRTSALQHADADLQRVGLADGVVDDVDLTGVAERQALPRAPQGAARPAGQLLDELEAGLGLEDGGAQAAGHLRLAGP